VASVQLGDLFSETDYPLDVRAKFAFLWRFIILEVPNGKTGILALRSMSVRSTSSSRPWKRPGKLAIQSLRSDFAGMISRITERFSNGDASKRDFQERHWNNFYEFFETFKERNHLPG